MRELGKPQIKGRRGARHAHELVAEVARGIAEEMFEQMMSDNALRAAWCKQHPEGASEAVLREAFVKQFLPRCIQPARATLAAMLQGPYNDDLKQPIADALILDRSLANPPTRTTH